MTFTIFYIYSCALLAAFDYTSSFSFIQQILFEELLSGTVYAWEKIKKFTVGLVFDFKMEDPLKQSMLKKTSQERRCA